MIETTNQPRVIRRAEILIPHDAGRIRFAHPMIGPGTYRNVGDRIRNASRLGNIRYVPTGDDTASLLYAAYCSKSIDEPEFKNVRDIMKNSSLWIFGRAGWTDKGVYVVQDPEAIGKSRPLVVKDLERRLKVKGGEELSGSGIRFSKNGMVRFAPKGSYILGSLNRKPEQIAGDGLMVATFGIEGAEKLAEVSKKIGDYLVIQGVNVLGEGVVVQRVLDVSERNGKFCFNGNHGDYDIGCAYGVMGESVPLSK